MIDLIIYPCWEQSLAMSVKRDLVAGAFSHLKYFEMLMSVSLFNSLHFLYHYHIRDSIINISNDADNFLSLATQKESDIIAEGYRLALMWSMIPTYEVSCQGLAALGKLAIDRHDCWQNSSTSNRVFIWCIFGSINLFVLLKVSGQWIIPVIAQTCIDQSTVILDIVNQ